MPPLDIFTCSLLSFTFIFTANNIKMYEQMLNNSCRWHWNQFFLVLQNLPTCSINLPASLQNLPKICTSWSSWCEESSSERQEEEEITGSYSCTATSTSVNDQPVATTTTTITQSSFHVPPKYPAKYYQRKMPFRRKNWCGCLQVSADLDYSKIMGALELILWYF